MTFPSDPQSRKPGVSASFYDGRSSARHAVTLTLGSGLVVVIGDGVERRESLESVEIADPVGTTPRLVRFRDGASCVVHDTVVFAEMLTQHGISAGRVTQWEGSLKWIGLSAVLVVLVLVAGYRCVLPPLAGVIAASVPEALVDAIYSQVMTALDGVVFGPSEVPGETQRRLISAFEHLRLPGAEPASFQIVFRSSKDLGANALAIPSGAIVVTDALVALAQADEEIVAVLAHEAGHIARRHGLRQLFQNSVVAFVVTWFLGDVSMLAAAAPTTLLQAKYSRDFERDADDYALQVLRANGLSPEHFIRMLERLEAAEGQTRNSGRAFAYLSSHPITAERIERVRGNR